MELIDSTLDEPPGADKPPHPWEAVPLAKWNDWRWQLSHRLNTLEELRQVINLTPEEEEGIAAEHHFRIDVTPYFASLIDPDDPNCPLRRQVIPTGRELTGFHAAMVDSLGEVRVGRARGHLESWKKWSRSLNESAAPSESLLQRNGWLPVKKTRLLSSFEVAGDKLRQVGSRPDNGCGFELTELSIGNRSWWTVGFEAVGPDNQLRDNVERVAQHVLPHCDSAQFTLNRSHGYPAWLCRIRS